MSRKKPFFLGFFLILKISKIRARTSQMELSLHAFTTGLANGFHLSFNMGGIHLECLILPALAENMEN
jgi:hypothetical protein